MNKRSVVLAIILTFVTCGIYGLYWFYKITNETHYAVGRKTTASGGMAIVYALITCGVYGLYWNYKIGDSILEAKEQRGMRTDKNIAFMYLFLSVVCLGLVSQALMQNALNDIIEFDETNHSAIDKNISALTDSNKNDATGI